MYVCLPAAYRGTITINNENRQDRHDIITIYEIKFAYYNKAGALVYLGDFAGALDNYDMALSLTTKNTKDWTDTIFNRDLMIKVLHIGPRERIGR